MKFLAVEIENTNADAAVFQKLKKQEALKVWEYFKNGIIENIYFNEEHNAVIILECNDKATAIEFLNQLPFVTHNLITFEITSLTPYTGFERLFCQ